MLLVTIELRPFDGELGKRVLGVAEIWNDGTGTAEIGNYNVVLRKFGGKGVWKTGRVEGWDRVNKGPWDLLYLALKSIVEERNRR